MGKSSTSFTTENAAENGAKGGAISKRKPFDQRMKEWMNTTLAELKNEKIKALADQLGVDPSATIEDLMRFSLLLNGLRGNTPAIKEALTRTYGRYRKGEDLDDDGDASKREPKDFIIKVDSSNVEEVPIEAEEKETPEN